MTDVHPLDRVWEQGRTSMRTRLTRLRSKSWHVGQAAVAAGVAWFVAADLLGHDTPFFAPIAAVVCLGTSYRQRLRRVAEVTVGVAVGVLVADILVLAIGSGAWQITAIVALAMTFALLLDAGQLLVTQAAVQSIVVATLVVDPGAALVRWTDALVGGAVALLAATVVPRAPLRRPQQQAAVVVRRIADLLRGAADGIVEGDTERAMALLRDARATDTLIRELQDAAHEGMSVLVSSPFLRRHRRHVREIADLVEPMDRAMRNTRVLVRRVAVAAYHREPLPQAYARLCTDLADATNDLAEALHSGEVPERVRRSLLAVGHGTSTVSRTSGLSADVVLAQLRSIVVDLLQLTGMDVLEATDALPPPQAG